LLKIIFSGRPVRLAVSNNKLLLIYKRLLLLGRPFSVDNFHLFIIFQNLKLVFPVDKSVDKVAVSVDKSRMPVDNFFACG